MGRDSHTNTLPTSCLIQRSVSACRTPISPSLRPSPALPYSLYDPCDPKPKHRNKMSCRVKSCSALYTTDCVRDKQSSFPAESELFPSLLRSNTLNPGIPGGPGGPGGQMAGHCKQDNDAINLHAKKNQTAEDWSSDDALQTPVSQFRRERQLYIFQI